MNARVLMYHDIRDLHETNFPKRYLQPSFLRVDMFKEHLDYIKSKYSVVSIEEIHKRLIDLSTQNIVCYSENEYNEKPMVALVFDDGLKDHFRAATEILKQYGITGCFCVPVFPIMHRKMIASNLIQFIIAEAAPNLDKVIDDIFDNYNISGIERDRLFQIFSRSRWKNNYWTPNEIFITNFLRSKETINYALIVELFKQYVTDDVYGVADDLYLHYDELIKLCDMGMIIGGHGSSSANLSRLAPMEQDDEIYKVKEFLLQLGNKLGEFYFSYPNGGHTGITRALMRKYGFDMAFVTGNLSLNELLENNVVPNIYSIPRIDASQYLYDLC